MHRRVSHMAARLMAAFAILAGFPAAISAEPVAWKLFLSKHKPADLSARAIGSYSKGCLAGARMLPVSGPGWEAMKLKRNRNWGHPVLIEFLERFAREVTEKDAWPGLLIGDLAMPRGGPFRKGHASHQIGLDADIWYRPKPKGDLSKKEREDSWSIPLAGEFGRAVGKNWKPGYVKVLKRAASYPQTARIFVHPAVKKALCENAGSDRAWLRKIRPWWKHNFHFHVRLSCPPGYEGCTDQKPPPAGDGCGPQLDDWMKLLKKAEEASKRPKKKPAKPGPGRRQLRLADLPAACRAVLDAGSGAARPAESPVPGRKSEAPARPRASAARTDPGLPWLNGVSAMPLPERKPR